MTNRALGSSAPVDVPAIPSGELDIMTLGRVLVASGYFQDVKDEAKAVTKILFGRELGIGPIASLLNIDIIQGKPCPKPALMAALIQRSDRFAYRVRESTNEACRIEFFEGNQTLGIASFTMEDARRAKLHEKTTWQQYPGDMLFARAMSQGARRFCPGIFLGVVYAPEELEGVETTPSVDPNTGEVIESGTLQPAPQPEPETETQALKRTTGHLFAAAAEAGINTEEIERMRRLCGAVLVREVEQVRTLDAADRATVGYWIQANPADAYLLAHPEGAEEAARGIAVRLAEAAAAGADYVPGADEGADEAEARRLLRLGVVQAAERGPYAQEMGI